jgi:histidinol-phosphate aminotransferase
MSPNDPTGTELAPIDAVRLSRRCAVVVVDERHAEYGSRTLLPLVREFDNIIVLRSFEMWAGLLGLPVAYAIAPPRLAALIAGFASANPVATGGIIAAEATLDDVAYVQATVQRVREEKSRLYRTLRKLNMMQPLPSWANFLLAHVERGNAEWFRRELALRDVIVHHPPQPGLEDYLRISGTRPEHTNALKDALIEIAASL